MMRSVSAAGQAASQRVFEAAETPTPDDQLITTITHLFHSSWQQELKVVVFHSQIHQLRHKIFLP